MTRKRLDEVNHPQSVKVSKSKVIDSKPEDILAMMEQLKDKLPLEQDPEESQRLIARIQTLNASYVQLMGTDAAAGPGAGGGRSVKDGLEEDLRKYAQELKAISAKESEQREQLATLREQLDESQPHIDRLRKERDTCSDVVRTLRDKITAINDEYQGKFDEYKTAMDSWAADRKDVLKER